MTKLRGTEAAKYLGIDQSVFSKLANRGVGPRYYISGASRKSYAIEDLEKFKNSDRYREVISQKKSLTRSS